MGFLVNFLSHPVISGFTSAAAFIIAISQLKYIFGIELVRRSNILMSVQDLISNLGQTNFIALIVGLIGIAVIVITKKINKNLPGALLAVVLGIVAVIVFDWSNTIQIVEEVPKGLPAFELPLFSWETFGWYIVCFDNMSDKFYIFWP